MGFFAKLNPFRHRGFRNFGRQLGDVTNNTILPGVITTAALAAAPLAGAAMAAAAPAIGLGAVTGAIAIPAASMLAGSGASALASQYVSPDQRKAMKEAEQQIQREVDQVYAEKIQQEERLARLESVLFYHTEDNAGTFDLPHDMAHEEQNLMPILNVESSVRKKGKTRNGNKRKRDAFGPRQTTETLTRGRKVRRGEAKSEFAAKTRRRNNDRK